MLQHDQHQRGERDHPEQLIAVERDPAALLEAQLPGSINPTVPGAPAPMYLKNRWRRAWDGGFPGTASSKRPPAVTACFPYSLTLLTDFVKGFPPNSRMVEMPRDRGNRAGRATRR